LSQGRAEYTAGAGGARPGSEERRASIIDVNMDEGFADFRSRDVTFQLHLVRRERILLIYSPDVPVMVEFIEIQP